MNKPIVVDTKPKGVELENGKDYYFCRCGRSQNQPFCDGSHEGTGLSPLQFTAEKDGTAYLCQCKQTGNAPFCDGTHAKVPSDQVGQEFSLDGPKT
jgi:CDGSH-type Zn-finger protein